MAVILSSNLVFAQDLVWARNVRNQEQSASPDLKQADWRAILENLKRGKKDSYRELLIDKEAIRIEGPGTSGGGNESDSEFYYLAGQLFADFSSLGISSSVLTSAGRAFEKLKAEKSVFFFDKKLVLDGREKAAINDFEVFVIVFNELRWNEASFEQKRRLIMHELLGLARAYDLSIDDSTYEISNSLFEKLEVANRKDFLRKSDYPKKFRPPSNLNGQMSTVGEISYTVDGKQKTCVNAGGEPTLILKTTTQKRGDRENLHLYFRILCRTEDGIFGHTQGEDDSDTLEVLSGNLLQMKNDFGSFVVGWMSGEDFFLRSPMMTVAVTKKTDGNFDFVFSFTRGQADEMFRATLRR